LNRRLLQEQLWPMHGPGQGNGLQRHLSQAGNPKLFTVKEVSYVSSISDAAMAGAWVVFLALLFFSGIWPYGKNIIMLVAWTVPMTASSRGTMLCWLTRFAKWSFVDVFVVAIIMAGLRIDTKLGGVQLLVLADAYPAIATFAIAALWNLTQGEWLRHKHIELLERCSREGQGNDPLVYLEPGCSAMSLVRFGDGQRQCSTLGKCTFTALALLQFCLTAAGLTALSMSFKSPGGLMSKGPGEDRLEYSLGAMCFSLVDAGWSQHLDNLPVAAFLMVLFFFLVMFLPLFESISITLVSLAPWDKLGCRQQRRFKHVCTLVDTAGAFACLDVFVLALFVAVIEWPKLLDGLNRMLQAECPPGMACLTSSTAGFEPGVLFILLAVVLGWVMEAFFSAAMAHIFYPWEKVSCYNRCFGLRPWTRSTENNDDVNAQAVKEAGEVSQSFSEPPVHEVPPVPPVTVAPVATLDEGEVSVNTQGQNKMSL